MNSVKIVTRLYEACGYSMNPHMAARLLGSGPHGVRECYGACVQTISSSALSTHNAIAHERKMWRALRIARVLSALPFVRGIAVCNSLALHMVHEDSDIDLFIVTAPDRVWSARWWVTGLLALLRLRPGETRRDPICVSFYIDESVADISHLMIDKDVYFYYWIRSLLPLYGTHVLFEDAARTAPEFRVQGKWVAIVRSMLELFAIFLPESFVRRQQERIMPDELKDAAEKKDTTVVLTDDVVKLHATDRRAEIRDRVFIE